MEPIRRHVLPLATLNAQSESDFVGTLGGIFEHAPWVAEGVCPARPFASLEDLHDAMCTVVADAGEARQLELIRAHPDLAGKAALAGELTGASSAEQSGAGLDRLSEDEYRHFHALNDSYKARFGFPFILAVKGHTKTSILSAFEERLPNSPEAERETALREIYKIARFRLEAL
jgi:2-oxo-4-hydroxy-4-carboxy-5-ureidoimidazoline decarboxylase